MMTVTAMHGKPIGQNLKRPRLDLAHARADFAQSRGVGGAKFKNFAELFVEPIRENSTSQY